MTNSIAITTVTVTLPTSIAQGFASAGEVTAFLHKIVSAKLQLTEEQRLACSYALARDHYRHGQTIRLRDLALLARKPVVYIQARAKKFFHQDFSEWSWLEAERCDKILSSLMDDE